MRLEVTEEAIRKAFGKYGKITSLCLKTSEKNVSYSDIKLKFCFVKYSSADEANKAFFEGKKDPEIKSLLHEKHNQNYEFLFYA